GVNQRGFAMVNVCDYRHVTNTLKVMHYVTPDGNNLTSSFYLKSSKKSRQTGSPSAYAAYRRQTQNSPRSTPHPPRYRARRWSYHSHLDSRHHECWEYRSG